MKAKKSVTKVRGKSQELDGLMEAIDRLMKAAASGDRDAENIFFDLARRTKEMTAQFMSAADREASRRKSSTVRKAERALEDDIELNPKEFDEEASSRHYNQIVEGLKVLFEVASQGSVGAQDFLREKAEEFIQMSGKLGWETGCPIKY